MRGLPIGLLSSALLLVILATGGEASAQDIEQLYKKVEQTSADQSERQYTGGENQSSQPKTQTDKKEPPQIPEDCPRCNGLDSDAVPVIHFWGIALKTSDTLIQGIVAFFAFISLFISAWGIWIVRETLRESKRATEVAIDSIKNTRELGMAQVRAYVTLADCIVEQVGVEEINVGISFKNSGQSPATVTKWRFNIVPQNAQNADYPEDQALPRMVQLIAAVVLRSTDADWVEEMIAIFDETSRS